jgi:hypothetical protein
MNPVFMSRDPLTCFVGSASYATSWTVTYLHQATGRSPIVAQHGSSQGSPLPRESPARLTTTQPRWQVADIVDDTRSSRGRCRQLR